eukprot:4980642-Amphidinium_carterae.1
MGLVIVSRIFATSTPNHDGRKELNRTAWSPKRHKDWSVAGNATRLMHWAGGHWSRCSKFGAVGAAGWIGCRWISWW